MTQLIIIGIYLLLLLGLGLLASRLFRGTSKDYMLASHSIGPFLLLMSLFGTTMTAFALVGSTGEAFKEGIGVYGMLASSSGIIHSLCFFVLGVKLWSLGRRYGYTTQIQYFRDRLESDRIGLLLFPILVGLVIPYLLIGVMASGTVINGVTEGAFTDTFAAHDYGIPKWLGSLVICGVVLVYVFFGGMRGTAWANTFQTIVFMILGVVTFFVISSKLGGLEAASQAVLEKHPSKLMRTITPKERETYQTSLKKWQAKAVAAYSAKNGLKRDLTAEEKQKALIAQDDRVAAAGVKLFDSNGKALSLSAFPKSNAWPKKAFDKFGSKVGHPNELLVPGDPTKGKKWTRKKALGVYKAKSWAPDEPHTLSKLKFLTYLLVPLSVGMFPHLFQHWLTARSASSFKLAVVAHPIFIMIVWVPCVLVGVWATSAVIDGRPLIASHFPPNAVLVKMVKDMTGPLLGGFLTAGILAAIMSSLDSQFLCIGTMFTNDIVVHYGGKDRFSERQKVLLARGFIVAIVAVTYGFSLLEPRRVFTLGVWCFSGFSSMFPLIFASLYWRRLTKAGAYASILAAIVSWVVLFWQSKFGLNPHYDVLGMMPVATMVASSTAALVLVSLVTRPPSEKALRRVFGPPGG
jgi:SSS family solute:Na+ symporter